MISLNDFSVVHRACVYEWVKYGQYVKERVVCETPSVVSGVVRQNLYSIGIGMNRGNI